MSLRFDDQVTIVTGAGQGLGRAYALALAERGAKLAVLDPAVGDDGHLLAEAVADEITGAGGTAIAIGASVTDEDAMQAMADDLMARWGRIDVLVNNAGFLRDRTFAKMDLADFRAVLDVHVMGSVNCAHAVWPHMRAANHGRIVLTTSLSGLFGNFGQANYATAKAAMIGLMNTLAIEGDKHDIRVNCLSPIAATAMTEHMLSDEEKNMLDKRHVTPALVFLASSQAPTGTILTAGGGHFSVTRLAQSRGLSVKGSEPGAESLAQRFDEITDMSELWFPEDGLAPTKSILDKGD